MSETEASMAALDAIDREIDAHFAECAQRHPEDCGTCADLFTRRADAHA